MKNWLLGLLMIVPLAACSLDEPDVLQCGNWNIEMSFSDNGDKMRAKINGDVLTLTHNISASGARYVGELDDTNITLWGKGTDWIMMINDGAPIDCIRHKI